MRIKAFSLVELLIIVAVVAVLAAVMFPVLAKANPATKTNQDITNLQQIGEAVLLYQNDADGMLPPTSTLENPRSWVEAVKPYSSNALATHSPLDNSPDWSAGKRHTSYGLNAYFLPNNAPYHGVKLSATVNPDSTVLAAPVRDTTLGRPMTLAQSPDLILPMYWGNPPKVTDLSLNSELWDSSKNLPKNLWYDIDGKRANYLFADGHVSNLAFAQTWRQAKGEAPVFDAYDPLKF